MSASTAAVPIATTNANHSVSLDSRSSQEVRKRAVAATKQKSTPETTTKGGVNGVADDKMVVSTKDLKHTIQGESVLEKLKYFPEVRKDVIASAANGSRQKKIIHKPPKPKWRTAIDVILKVCLLILALFSIWQLIIGWRSGRMSFTATDIERRLADVEGLRNTAKMLQVQLDILDNKIGSEIDKAKKDLMKQVDNKGMKLESNMKKLEVKTDKLDKSLIELREMSFVSKKEFDEFLNDFKKKKGFSGNDRDISLDDIRHFAKEIVEEEIEKHAADGLGMADYALASGGAKVVKHSEPFVPGKGVSWFAGAKDRSGIHPNAKKMLEPSFGEPGQCFALQGSTGFVEIKLRTGIIPEAVTLEHVPKGVAYDRTSAPKDCHVTAWFEGPDDDKEAKRSDSVVLTEFSYDLEKSNAQTFKFEGAVSRVINMVRLDFSSNHGSSSLTCIYRFRVHGTEPSALGATPVQAE